MKFMKLGSRPDAFFTANGVRSISSEVRCDLIIQVNETRFLLHKRSFRVMREILLRNHDHYKPYNIVSARCASKYLQMTEDFEKGNLVHKLEVFFNSCVLNGWKDCIVTLQTTKRLQSWSEELGITSRCIEAVVSKVLSNPLKVSLSHNNLSQNGDKEDINGSKGWWGEDLSELRMDLYRRIMTTLKSCGKVPANLIGDALKIYTSKWLPKISRNLETAFCSKLLKAANILQASSSSRMELARRVASQLDEAKVCDLMIPSVSNDSDTIYDLDVVLNIVEQFLLQIQGEKHVSLEKRLELDDNGDCDFDKSCRLSSSGSSSRIMKVGRLVDGYLQEIGRDVNVPLSKFIALIEVVPQVARVNHDDLYRAIDIYLKLARLFSSLTKEETLALAKDDVAPRPGQERKETPLSITQLQKAINGSMHARSTKRAAAVTGGGTTSVSRFPFLLLHFGFYSNRFSNKVLFFEQARAATADGHLTALPSHIKALLAAKAGAPISPSTLQPEDQWVMTSRNPSVTSSRVQPAVDDDDEDVDGSSKVKQNCSIGSKPKRTMFGKLWSMNSNHRQNDNYALKT
ncbi:hypothetical protein OSB04_021958 [Centaurea solstitialis]|uniref:NPH3 domain-containing protein n=1 Tax=Centaurea solstitialis TaxID=347529 RepID=A0AA38T775_9ASTR|nr:hypothetical protein OSB04_021958 [Centaurea solstitialis]